MPLDETGFQTSPKSSLKIYHVIKGDLVSEASPVFFQGDTYIIDNGSEIYIWIGKNSTVDEEFAGAWFANHLDVSRDVVPKVISIEEGKEPRKLLILLGPNFKVVPGGVESILRRTEVREPSRNFTSDFLETLTRGEAESKNYRDSRRSTETYSGTIKTRFEHSEAEKEERVLNLYTVSGDGLANLPLSKLSLNSTGCFILEMPKVIYVWEGQNTSATEKYKAARLARMLDAKRKFLVPVKIVTEGNELSEFLRVLASRRILEHGGELDLGKSGGKLVPVPAPKTSLSTFRHPLVTLLEEINTKLEGNRTLTLEDIDRVRKALVASPVDDNVLNGLLASLKRDMRIREETSGLDCIKELHRGEDLLPKELRLQIPNESDTNGMMTESLQAVILDEHRRLYRLASSEFLEGKTTYDRYLEKIWGYSENASRVWQQEE